MSNNYSEVNTRFLAETERLILSDERELPLVIEPKDAGNMTFLQEFLHKNSSKILQDIAQYGAVLLRGFEIDSEENFEKTVLSIQGMRGISEAFMSEEGRVPVGNLQYVLHTNAVYKTGGTLYLGGFHSENYYSADVPAYISFFCLNPSLEGGETGLINMEKIYAQFDQSLQEKIEKNRFFVKKWLLSEVAERYQLTPSMVEEICRKNDLPVLGENADKFVLMYKPGVFEHPITGKKSMQINLFEIESLNRAMRLCFMEDYAGKDWFWHRFFWKMPDSILKIIEFFYIICASFFYSPKDAIQIAFNTWKTAKASKKLPPYPDQKAGSCFTEKEVNSLAKLIRQYYSSCLWQKGDVLLVDNRKIMHAGMPGKGPRLVRAMICNPLDMQYEFKGSGIIPCDLKHGETVGYQMKAGDIAVEVPDCADG